MINHLSITQTMSEFKMKTTRYILYIFAEIHMNTTTSTSTTRLCFLTDGDPTMSCMNNGDYTMFIGPLGSMTINNDDPATNLDQIESSIDKLNGLISGFKGPQFNDPVALRDFLNNQQGIKFMYDYYLLDRK